MRKFPFLVPLLSPNKNTQKHSTSIEYKNSNKIRREGKSNINKLYITLDLIESKADLLQSPPLERHSDKRSNMLQVR